MKEADALNTADAKITFNGADNKITISSLEANLDKTSLKGNASISNFKKPLYGFDLTLNQLNLDYYALATMEQANTTAKTMATKSRTNVFKNFLSLDFQLKNILDILHTFYIPFCICFATSIISEILSL